MGKINLIGPLKLNHSLVNFALPSYFIDGGIQHKHLFPNALKSIGDGDSSNRPMDISLAKTKNFSDTSYAINYVLPMSDKLFLHGFDGKRFDHQLALIGDLLTILENYSNKDIILTLLSGEKWLFTSKKQTQIPHNGEFSLFSLRTQEIKYHNCQYPLEEHGVTFQGLSSLGISNTCESYLEISNTYPILLMLKTPS